VRIIDRHGAADGQQRLTRPIQNFDVAVEEAFVIVRPWLEVILPECAAHPGQLEQPVLGRSLVETSRITGNPIKTGAQFVPERRSRIFNRYML